MKTTNMDINQLWELVGEFYVERYANESTEQILAQLAMAHQELADLRVQRDYLYKHARENVRDIPPSRNKDIEDWVKRGASDSLISKHLVKGISVKVVKNVRTQAGIKKPKGRPKKSE